MSRPCTICTSPKREGIETAVRSGLSQNAVAKRFGFSASTVASHRKHADVHPEPTQLAPGHHAAIAAALVDERRAKRGENFTKQDEAEAGQLVAIATALDFEPTSVGLLREYRVSLEQFRRNSEESAAAGEVSLATFLRNAVVAAREGE